MWYTTFRTNDRSSFDAECGVRQMGVTVLGPVERRRTSKSIGGEDFQIMNDKRTRDMSYL